MKNLLFILIIALPNLLFSQGFIGDHFFGRSPSARAEAMGRAYTSLNGDLSSIFYNPAGTAGLKGLSINGSTSSPYSYSDRVRYSFLSAGYSINNYLTVALSHNQVSWDLTEGNDILERPFTSSTTVNISSEPIQNLYIGLNANYFSMNPNGSSATSIYFDFGVIKKFILTESKPLKQSINLGASISNLNSAEVEIVFLQTKSKESLPNIARLGASYQLELDKNLLSDSLNTARLIVQADYQANLNSENRDAINVGTEVLLFEILALRAGYYKEKIEDYGFTNYNNSELSEFTYGVGVQLPINKLTKLPLNIAFDYTSLELPNYSKADFGSKNFSTYTLTVNWLI